MVVCRQLDTSDTRTRPKVPQELHIRSINFKTVEHTTTPELLYMQSAKVSLEMPYSHVTLHSTVLAVGKQKSSSRCVPRKTLHKLCVALHVPGKEHRGSGHNFFPEFSSKPGMFQSALILCFTPACTVYKSRFLSRHVARVPPGSAWC